MKLDLIRTTSRIVPIQIRSWPRIILAKHAATPAGTGYGSSRFSSRSNAFKVLYAASTFEAAFAETVVRDRFVQKQRRYLYRPDLEARMVTEITSHTALHLIDLRGGATYALGIESDTTRASKHDKGQELSEELHARTAADGILYDSRIQSHACVAIFDRAFTKISATNPVDLIRVPNLTVEIINLGITVRNRRGV